MQKVVRDSGFVVRGIAEMLDSSIYSCTIVQNVFDSKSSTYVCGFESHSRYG